MGTYSGIYYKFRQGLRWVQADGGLELNVLCVGVGVWSFVIGFLHLWLGFCSFAWFAWVFVQGFYFA